MFAKKPTAHRFSVLLKVVLILAALIGSAAIPIRVRAASPITVTSTDDNTKSASQCSLREAVSNANADNPIGAA